MQSCANGTTYSYDGDEERVKKSNGTLYWGGGPGDALAESDLSGNLTQEYIFFNGRRVAMRNASTHVVSYYVLDHLGSTSVLADAAANIINDSDYTPYGGEMPFTAGNPGQHYKFTGKERDAETGNDYFGARYFANNMGRWLSPDWSAKVEPVPYSKLDDPQSLNLYSYVGNNPMMRVDPDGHGCEKASGGSSPECKAPPDKAQQQSQVRITYNKGVPAMKPKTQDYVEKVSRAAGVKSINISATTNGKHAKHSNHYNGTAVDINKVNGAHVREAGTNPSVAADAKSLQNAANSPSVGIAHENYGPSGLYKDGHQITNPTLQSQHENHIHFTIPRNTNDDN